MPIDYGTNNVSTSGNISVSGVITAISGVFNSNIGIGISNPSEKLEIDGNIKADNIIHPFLLGGM